MMKYIFILLLGSLSWWMQAQAPGIVDQKVVNADVTMVDAKPTPDGGHIFVGYRKSMVEVRVTKNIYLAKLRADGSKEWEENHGDIDSYNRNPMPLSVQPTSDGGYLILAHYTATDGYTLPHLERRGILLIKTNQLGKVNRSNMAGNASFITFQREIEQEYDYFLGRLSGNTYTNFFGPWFQPGFKQSGRTPANITGYQRDDANFGLAQNPFIKQLPDDTYLLIYNKVQSPIEVNGYVDDNGIQRNTIRNHSNPILVKINAAGMVMREETMTQPDDVIESFPYFFYGEEDIYDLALRPDGSITALTYLFRSGSYNVDAYVNGFSHLLPYLNPPNYKNNYLITADVNAGNKNRTKITNNTYPAVTDYNISSQTNPNDQPGELYYQLFSTLDGGTVMLGRQLSSTGINGILRKTNASGTELWKRTFTGRVYEECIATQDGGFLLRSGGYLRKLDKDGNFGGTGTWETTLSVAGYKMYQGIDGAFYFIGATGPQLIKVGAVSNSTIMYVDHFTGDASEANKIVMQIGGTAADRRELEAIGVNDANKAFADWTWQDGKTYLWKLQYTGSQLYFTLYNGLTASDGGVTLTTPQPYTVLPNGLEIKANVNSSAKSGTKATIHMYTINGKSVGGECKAEAIGDEVSNYWSKVYFISQEFQRSTGFTAFGTIRIDWAGTSNPQLQNLGGNIQFQLEPNYDISHDGATYR